MTVNKLSCISRVKRTTSGENTRPDWRSDYIIEEFIGDRSGSMKSMSSSSLKVTEEFLKGRRKLARESTTKHYNLSCTTFDDKMTLVFEKSGKRVTNKDIEDAVNEMTPRGSTRLIDTIYNRVEEVIKKIQKIKSKWSKEEMKLQPVISACISVLTDGVDNVSFKTARELNHLINIFESVHGGTAMFLAANQDAIVNGTYFGFKPGKCITFAANNEGCAAAIRSASAAMTRTCSGKSGNFNYLERTTSMPINRSNHRTDVSGLTRTSFGTPLSLTRTYATGLLTDQKPAINIVDSDEDLDN